MFVFRASPLETVDLLRAVMDTSLSLQRIYFLFCNVSDLHCDKGQHYRNRRTNSWQPPGEVLQVQYRLFK